MPHDINIFTVGGNVPCRLMLRLGSCNDIILKYTTYIDAESYKKFCDNKNSSHAQRTMYCAIKYVLQIVYL